MREMRIIAKAGEVAEVEIRDWRVVRADGVLGRLYRTFVEILLDEVRHLPEMRRRALLPQRLRHFGFEILAEEWPAWGEVPPEGRA